MLVGGGGNTGVFIGANGVTVVDTKNPGYGTPILNKIKELTPKPVTMIINTHTHGDHVSGNVEFPATVDVVTQENTAANMKKMAPVTGLAQSGPPANIFEQNGGRNLAKRTFKDRMTIGNGAERIELYYFGRAHTNGDAWVVFPALRVVHVGDTFAGKTPPIMDANNGGSGVDYPEHARQRVCGLKNVDTIINGHTSPDDLAELKEYEEYMQATSSRTTRPQLKAGKSVDDARRATKVPDRFKGYTAAGAREIRRAGHLQRAEEITLDQAAAGRTTRLSGAVPPVRSSVAPLRPRRRRRIPGIFRPRMLRIAASQLLPHLGIGPIPEAFQVARHLDRTSVRREQRQENRLTPRADPRRLGQARTVPAV